MAKIQWKGGALLAPVPPVLVTTGSCAAPNVCTAAWCGMLNTQPPMVSVSLRPSRYSHRLLLENGEFVLNLPTAALVRAIDRCGVKSGLDENKFKTCGLTPLPSFTVAPPGIAQSPVGLECRVESRTPLGSHDLFIARVLAVAVEEGLVDANGRLTLEKAGLCAFAHGDYFQLGRKIGSFGFSVRKRPAEKPRRKI